MEKGMRGLLINSHGHRGLVYSDSSGVVGFAEERGTLVAVTFRWETSVAAVVSRPDYGHVLGSGMGVL